jgi:hypothetical protein
MDNPRLFVVGVLSALIWWGNPTIPRVHKPRNCSATSTRAIVSETPPSGTKTSPTSVSSSKKNRKQSTLPSRNSKTFRSKRESQA